MKKLIASLFAFAVVASASVRAATLAQETQELRLQGLLDPSTVDGSELSLSASYGYFFLDNLQAGGRIDLVDKDELSKYGLGAFVEYNWDFGTEITPFGELVVGLANADIEGAGGDDLAGLVELRAGAKYFLAANIAIAAAGVFALATEKIYPDKSKVRETDVFLELSLRSYF
jgi:hypothetical protein